MVGLMTLSMTVGLLFGVKDTITVSLAYALVASVPCRLALPGWLGLFLYSFFEHKDGIAKIRIAQQSTRKVLRH